MCGLIGLKKSTKKKQTRNGSIQFVQPHQSLRTTELLNLFEDVIYIEHDFNTAKLKGYIKNFFSNILITQNSSPVSQHKKKAKSNWWSGISEVCLCYWLSKPTNQAVNRGPQVDFLQTSRESARGADFTRPHWFNYTAIYYHMQVRL